MERRAAQPGQQRIVVLAMVLVLHGAFLLLMLQRASPGIPEIKRSAISIISIDAERPAAAKPPPLALPAKVANTFKPLTEFSLSDAVESDAPPGATGACSTPQVVLDALLLDQVALDALRNSPPETRSVAEAVVMWNEGWTPFALNDVSPLRAVRINIERSLASLEDACLDEPVTGPRLLPVPDATEQGTILIVLGSGVWTWRRLINAPPMMSTDGAGLLPIAPPGQ